MTRHVDVLIIGAGLSGIGMACHLTRERPEHSFAILERRDSIGGTWDLFRYPGIRSDSDMYTFGYGFRPWNGTKVLADGPNIRQYIEDTARGPAASWSAAPATTTTTTATGPSSPARRTSAAGSCTRSTGPRIWTTAASAWW
ncbi:monooxygenase [Mycobacteroides abscessus subsp. abscessus]|nr:monooxygenase [Mycobacteroides abscessus subsp. abscessus]